MGKTKEMSTKTLVMAAVLTALVALLQYVGGSIKLGPFSISLVLIPIVIGAATCGIKIGTWLGFVFGVAVLLSGDAGTFLAVNVIGTVITVLLKGMACGFFAGLAFKGISKLSKNNYLATMVAAVICPLVNTGVFLLGCLLFFMETITMWAGGSDVGHYIIFVLVGGNFLAELAINIIFAPAIVQIMKVIRR